MFDGKEEDIVETFEITVNMQKKISNVVDIVKLKLRTSFYTPRQYNMVTGRCSSELSKRNARRVAGRLFHVRGPATANLRSPNLLFSRNDHHLEDRSCRRPESAMSEQALVR